MMDSRNRPRLAVVTGGASGIGLAIAVAALKAGYVVAVGDRDAAGLKRLVARHKQPSLHVFEVDVTDEAQVDEWANEVENAHGVTHALVNNAGIIRFGDLESLSVSDWRAVIEVNLTAAFIVTQRFGRRMAAAGRGSIVSIASVGSLGPAAHGGAYASSKAGIAMLMQQVAVEWGRYGIRANAISPGMIRGGLSSEFYKHPEVECARRALVPLRRLGVEDDIASAVLFLWSDAASYISGVNLAVDGAFTKTAVSRSMETLNQVPGLISGPADEGRAQAATGARGRQLGDRPGHAGQSPA